jgi:TolA-binding protein
VPAPTGRKDVPAPPSQKEAQAAPSTGAAASTDPPSADVAQSLKTIAQGLAGINDKLDQLKSSHEQTLREHADSIQQLKTAQEQNARESARIAEQMQALQAQLATLSAKPPSPAVKKENNVAARPHVPVAAPRRADRPRGPWMPRSYIVEPWDDPYW